MRIQPSEIAKMTLDELFYYAAGLKYLHDEEDRAYKQKNKGK